MFNDTPTSTATVALPDELMRQIMQPSWLGATRDLLHRVGDRVRSLIGDLGAPEASRTREHRAWAEGTPSAYDGPRDRGRSSDGDDSPELSSIIEQFGD